MARNKNQQSVRELFSSMRGLSENKTSRSQAQQVGVRKEYVRLREMFDTFQKNFEENKCTDVDEEQIKVELNKLAIDENLTLEKFMGMFDALLKHRCFIKCLFNIKVCYLSEGNSASTTDKHIDRLTGIYCYIMVKKDMVNNRPAIEKYIVPELVDIIRRLEECEQEAIQKAQVLFNSLRYNIEKIVKCGFEAEFDQSIANCEHECWEKSALRGMLYMHMDRRDIASIFYGEAINHLSDLAATDSRKAYFQYLKTFADACRSSVPNWSPLNIWN